MLRRAATTTSDLSSEWGNENFGEVETWRKKGLEIVEEKENTFICI